MKRILLALLALAAFATGAHAELRAPFKVRYSTDNGWSSWVETDVTFVTGQELNTATASFKYSGFASYAVIFFSQNQAAVIKSCGYSMCSSDFDTSCLPLIVNFKGTDEGGREWEICTTNFCF